MTRCLHIFQDCTYCAKSVGHKGRCTKRGYNIGTDAATFTRIGHATFTVAPRDFPGTHTLELLWVMDGDDFRLQAYLDGAPLETSGFVGLWDLPTEVSVGGSLTLTEGDF